MRCFLLWDLDGTLVRWRTWRIFTDTSWLHWRFLAPHTGFLRAAWHSTRAYLAMLENDTDLPNSRFYMEEFSRRVGLGVERVRELEEAFFREGLAPLSDYIRAIPEARELFEKLVAEGRHRMVGATNASMARAFNVARLGWAGYDPDAFVHVTGTETSCRMKGDVRFWEELLAELGAGAEECLVIGNDGKKDLVAARLGIPVFLVRNGLERNLGALADVAPDGTGDYAALERWIRGHSGR